MSMYNLLEYSDNYEDSTGSFYHFKRSEITTGNDNNADATVDNSKSVAYRASLVGDAVNNVELVVRLKYIGNFLIFNDAAGNNNVTFQITNTKLYVSIVRLLTKDTTHLTNLLSEGFKRSVFWNEYKVKICIVAANANNNWHALLDVLLRVLIDYLFLLSI